MEQMIGWRKLGAWLLIFALCAVATLRLVWTGAVTDIPAGLANVLIWITTAFFLANVVGEHTGSSPALAMKQAASERADEAKG